MEAVEAHLAEEDDGNDLGADDDTLSALASIAAEAAFAKDAVALGKCCRDAAQTLGDAEIPLLDRSDGDGVAAAAQACVAALCASVQFLEDDVGDESDWRAGALAGCYAALLAQTPGRAEAALDVFDLLGFRGGGRDVRGFAEALAENASDADAALKLLATLTDAERRAVVLCRVGRGTRRARARGAGGGNAWRSARTTTPAPLSSGDTSRPSRRVMSPGRSRRTARYPELVRPIPRRNGSPRWTRAR